MTRAQIIWATAYVLAMDRPLPNNIPPIKEDEPVEEEEDNEPNS